MRRIALLGPVALSACASVVTGPATLESTRWAVTAINGRAAPTSADYRLDFADGRIGGRLGCNSIGGRYAIGRETLSVRDLASTLMGCPEPAASFEVEGSAVLASPMRMSWTSGRMLTLSNARGSIVLQRIP